jgi:hypothetical protein
LQSLRWNNTSTGKLLARLGAVPAACGLKRIIGGIRISDYEDLIPGPRAKKTLSGYACALLSIGVTLMLGNIPDKEQYEIILEQQDRYALQAQFVFSALTDDPNPRFRNKDGDLKIAKWSYVSSKSTILFDQADYLCYALAQKHKNPQSLKSRWCAPILESDTDTIGRIMTKEEIRDAISREPFPGSNNI